MQLNVKDCLFGEVISAKRGTPLKDIIKICKVNHLHNLPVVDADNKVVGKVSISEILSVFQPQSSEINELLKTIPLIDSLPEAELDIRNLTPEMGILIVADEIMSKNYFTVKPDDTIAKAYTTMKTHDVRLLMVVDDEDHLMGVVSLFDIIYAMFSRKGVIE